MIPSASMKSCLPILLALFLMEGLEVVCAQETVKPLRSIDDIRKLTYEEARLAPPVLLRVNVISHLLAGFDGQDHTGGMFFEIDKKLIPNLGDNVEIEGNVTGGFYGPYIVVDRIKRHGRGGQPKPLYFRPDFVQTGLGDNRWIEIEGLLVDVEFGDGKRNGTGLLVTGENELEIRFRNRKDDFDVNRLENWEGSWIRLKGSGAPLFNDQRQRIGTDIVCSSHHFVEMVRETKDIPQVSLGEIGRWDTRRTTPGLVQTEGFVTLIEGARSLILQQGESGARVQTLRPHEAKIGDHLKFTGLPDTEGYYVGLRYANRQEEDSPAEASDEAPPTLETLPEPAPLSRANAMRLVSIQGKLMETQGRLLSMQVGDDLVPVRLAEGMKSEELPTIASELAVTGVKLVEADHRGQVRSVTLATRAPSDIKVLQVPSWWTPQRYLIAISILVASVFLFVFWTLALKRRVQKQTHLIQNQLVSNAALEERNRIARELHDTLSQGFSGVGYQLASVKNHLETNPERALEKLETAKQMVEHSLAEARESLTGLRVPTAADSLRFPETTIAIARERCEEADLRLVVHHTLDLDPTTLDSETAYACHRILLEGVMNAIRHSGGDSVGIATGSTEHEWLFYICDNGHGFDPEIKPAGHFGIQGMQERARQIEAGLTVESSPEGTCLALTLLRNSS